MSPLDKRRRRTGCGVGLTPPPVNAGNGKARTDSSDVDSSDVDSSDEGGGAVTHPSSKRQKIFAKNEIAHGCGSRISKMAFGVQSL